MKISELKPGAHIELRFEIVNMGKMRQTWKCFECNQKGVWEKEEDFKDECPNCSAKQSTERAKGVWIQRVTSAWIKDESGEVSLTLWNDQIDQFKPGDKVHMINGYCSEYEGKLQVSRGKYGVIEVAKEST